MNEFKDRVAVITGAASGIGRGLARRCAQEGMKVVLADIDVPALSNTAAELQATGAVILTVPTDVSKAGDVEALAHKTLETFGAIHLLFNNAGVATVPIIWESSFEEWKWILGVNLWGVIHGIHFFVPIMLNQAVGGHIVNTASIAGLISAPGLGVYKVSKHGVVTLSETLYHVQRRANVKVSVLCPGFVDTNLMDTSARTRPPTRAKNAEEVANEESLREAARTGTSPDHVAECVFTALKEDKFYILPHPEWKEQVQLRMEDILYNRNPCNPWASDAGN
jgi:NAD(P)-dependent dehydrogenase (short-subunit alcohol dehydrogenase family)